MSENSGARKGSVQGRASKQVSSVSERAKGQAGGPVLTSRFMAVLNYCRHEIRAGGMGWRMGGKGGAAGEIGGKVGVGCAED